ncbi:hypothetical protein NNJEOMEG_02289 [Fundidesulfovibrio magnetotacticus]|uniref:Uncharacterized protein n=1 Tax=Fundidesulfovibrio magnetotacticus TaxID=2730080 RepID=A0A6V8LRU0_9BACT|nr:hypothetical protein [Fundidesulfovibrio magnetotacticus]GFK94444.1 hypothetical protein NNJEOMEG_02289 [Fundidesulfovibrio magnetotacticus]
MAGGRFKPGRAHGGARAVVDTHRRDRAVCLLLPDPERPGGPARVEELICAALNAEHERIQAAHAARSGA